MTYVGWKAYYFGISLENERRIARFGKFLDVPRVFSID